MKVFLMYRDHDFDMKQELSFNAQALTQDLELNTLFNAMSRGDKFLFDVAEKAVLSSVVDRGTILNRQSILKDCLKNASIVREIFDIIVETTKNKKTRYYGFYSRYPSSILYASIEVMQMLVGQLKKIKKLSETHAESFESEGFTNLFQMINNELTDEYFSCVQDHLKELKFRNGILISAELGAGNKGVHHVLHKLQNKKAGWLKRLFSKSDKTYTYRIADRDENGARALTELRNRGLNLVANALAQSNDHILGFLDVLLTELAFYVGCLNLHERLSRIGMPVCFPVPEAPGARRHAFQGLYDACLALKLGRAVVGNDADAAEKSLLIVTGANQGGKSTFLRSIGSSQLMMQCGMFVPAASFHANVCNRLFTHYRREEDVTMESGKLDEELGRMSDIVDHIEKDCLVLFNESFAATNEREGSEIARQIVCALLEKHIKVFFVTHLYEFAHGFYGKRLPDAVFLRAERQTDGGRTFKIIEGAPLETSYGEDLYADIFGAAASGTSNVGSSARI